MIQTNFIFEHYYSLKGNLITLTLLFLLIRYYLYLREKSGILQKNIKPA